MRVRRWRRASSSSAPGDRPDGRLTTTSSAMKRRSPIGGTPLRRGTPGRPAEPRALGKLPTPDGSGARLASGSTIVLRVLAGAEGTGAPMGSGNGIRSDPVTPSCAGALGRPFPGTPIAGTPLPMPGAPGPMAPPPTPVPATPPPPRARSCADASTGINVNSSNDAAAKPTRRGQRAPSVRPWLRIESSAECIARNSPEGGDLKPRSRETAPLGYRACPLLSAWTNTKLLIHNGNCQRIAAITVSATAALAAPLCLGVSYCPRDSAWPAPCLPPPPADRTHRRR
jgi:hypothetical protein